MPPKDTAGRSFAHAGLSRRAFMSAISAGLGALAWSESPRSGNTSRRKPNVLLIVTDDQGYGDIGCLGSHWADTPNLDRLHGESLRLSNFHVSPTCAPTRAALMTGQYNNRVGVWHTIMGRSILRRDVPTMADYFSGAGYKTAIFGKWHLGDNYPCRPQERGFSETLVHGGGGVGQAPDYWGNDYFDDTYFHNGEPRAFKGYCTDVWFENAERFITSHQSEPFFCYLATNASHGPYRVAPEFSEPFSNKGLTEEQANFLGMIKNIDNNVGKLLATLERLQLADDTIAVFMTDNGSAVMDAPGMRDRKGSEYEGGHRVPCFIRWREGLVNSGRDVPVLAAHFDLLPTLLDCCGIPVQPDKKLDGINLRPWLENPSEAEPDRTIIVDSQRIERPEKWRKSAVLQKNWRLVNGTALYNLESDPLQQIDRAGEFPEKVAQLREHYERWWADISTTFDTYCPITIGAPDAGPQILGSMDWHGETPAWNQTQILKGMPGNGFWAIEVAESGNYQFELRRWPVEASAPIRSALQGGVALDITEASITLRGEVKSAPVGERDHAVRFTFPLEKGEAQLKTVFRCGDGQERGAYYVVAERLSSG